MAVNNEGDRWQQSVYESVNRATTDLAATLWALRLATHCLIGHLQGSPITSRRCSRAARGQHEFAYRIGDFVGIDRLPSAMNCELYATHAVAGNIWSTNTRKK